MGKKDLKGNIFSLSLGIAFFIFKKIGKKFKKVA